MSYMLYKRDFTILTDKEKTTWDKVEERYSKIRAKNNGFTPGHLYKYWDEIPLAVRFHKSLFPNNNYMDESDDLERTQKIIMDFESLLTKSVKEREILNFIKEKEAYFLITTTVLPEFSTGNHDSYIFREFPLPPNFFADFLVIGKNSGGYDFIFVELENVSDDITTKTGEFGTTIRKGIKQIEEWDAWIDSNFSHLKLVFNKSKNAKENLSEEFLSLDKSRIHYAVIAGRRADYTEKTYRLRRKTRKNQEIAIIHYDNLVDNSKTRLNEALELEKKTKTS